MTVSPDAEVPESQSKRLKLYLVGNHDNIYDTVIVPRRG